MPPRKKKQDDRPKAARERPQTVVHVQAMNEFEARRLHAAVDALLTEWVRRQMGRDKTP